MAQVWIVMELGHDDYPKGIEAICSTQEKAKDIARSLVSGSRKFSVRAVDLDKRL